MLERLRDNFTRGLRNLKWFATVFSERVKLEIAVMKLLYQSNEMEETRDSLYKTIGRRVYEFKGNPEKNILRDRAVLDAIEQIEKLEKNIDEVKHRAAELGRAG